MKSIRDWQEPSSMNSSLQRLIEEKILSTPRIEVFSLDYNGKKHWVKKARKTGSNLLHRFTYTLTKNPILTPVEKKSAKSALQYESSKLKRLHDRNIRVPNVILVEKEYFVIEDCGPNISYLFKKKLVKNPQELLEKAITELAKLHNQNEYHGGPQIKNLTYKNNMVYFIDFEESFSDTINLKDLHFRDLFLFLYSISRRNIEIDYSALLHTYINITNNRTIVSQFQKLIASVSFLMKLLENKFIWNIIDKDTKSVYKLFKQLHSLLSSSLHRS